MRNAPLHPTLAELERAYFVLRSEADAGAITLDEAAQLLADAAVTDTEGNRWWVDLHNSGGSAAFMKEVNGRAQAADPSGFMSTVESSTAGVQPAPENTPFSPMSLKELNDATGVHDSPKREFRMPAMSMRLTPTKMCLAGVALFLTAVAVFGGSSETPETDTSTSTVPPATVETTVPELSTMPTLPPR